MSHPPGVSYMFSVAGEAGMAKKEFRRANSEDFEIVEEGAVFGTIRVRPSTVLWKAKGKHSWRGVTIEEFAQFTEKYGKDQKK